MIPYLLDGKAIEGPVVAIELDHFEVARVNTVRRPLVTIHSDAERALPVGKELWSTTEPGGPSWVVHAVAPAGSGGSLVTMKRQTSRTIDIPTVGETVTFSIHNTAYRRPAPLPVNAPWPLRPVTEARPSPIEADAGAA
jgi:hypothetical protein